MFIVNKIICESCLKYKEGPSRLLMVCKINFVNLLKERFKFGIMNFLISNNIFSKQKKLEIFINFFVFFFI